MQLRTSSGGSCAVLLLVGMDSVSSPWPRGSAAVVVLDEDRTRAMMPDDGGGIVASPLPTPMLCASFVMFSGDESIFISAHRCEM